MIRPPPTSTLFPYTTLFRFLFTVTVFAPPLPRQPRLVHPELHDPPLLLLGDVRRAPVRAAEADVGGVLAEHVRSEEHTSELQSQSNLVCRLLLEKKKNHNIQP